MRRLRSLGRTLRLDRDTPEREAGHRDRESRQHARLHFQPFIHHTCTVKLADPTISAKAASLRYWYGASIADFLVSSSESYCTRGGACPELVEWVSRRTKN